MNSKILVNSYFGVGIAYGLTRSWYWLGKTQDESYVMKNDRYTHVQHPHTNVTKFLYTCSSVMTSQAFWPVFALSDLNYYEKEKLGIKEMFPPFPFNSLKWKSE